METTEALIRHLNDLSAGRLKHPKTLQVLFDTTGKTGQERTLEALAFDAKFCHKTHGIMKRIGPEGEGYDVLAREFGDAIQRCRNYLREILALLSDTDRQQIEEVFLALTPEGMENLLALLHDLSWYKNYQIDARNALS